MTKLSRVLQFAFAQRWALEDRFHAKLFEVLEKHADGGAGLLKDLRATAAGETTKRAGPNVDKGVAVIPIHGVIAQRASAVDDICADAGTSVEHIRRDLQAALTNPDVQAIVLDVDSPGGSVGGLADLAAEIRDARARKPIMAHTDAMMASAAYWLASQASRVYATRDADVGSIGVIASFLDNHRNLAERGLDPIVVKSVPGKGHVQSSGAFGDSQRADLQREIDHFHAMFVADVAAGRGKTADEAKAMGDGRVYIGSEAHARGFTDGVKTFAKVMTEARSAGREHRKAIADLPDHKQLHVDDVDVDAEHEESSPPEAGVAEGNPVTTGDTMTEKITPATPAPAAATPAATNPVDQLKAERARASAIQSASIPEQHALVSKLIADGTPADEAIAAIAADLKARLAAARTLPEAKTAPLGQGNSAGVAPAADGTAKPEPFAGLEGEDLWKAQWKANKALRSEFDNDEAVYLASMRNEGRARKVASRSQFDAELKSETAI